jgi:hypothetical protein
MYREQIAVLSQNIPRQYASSSSSSSLSAAHSDSSLSASLGLAIVAASSLPPIPTFDGSGDTSGLAAFAWLQQFELAFDARAKAIGMVVPDGQRVAAAFGAMRGHASTWLTSLQSTPADWSSFKKALLERFQPAGAYRIIEAKLESLVDSAMKIRERLNSEGVQHYTQKFVQLANQVPASDMLDRTKILNYAKGLPARLREFVYQQDEKARSPGSTALSLHSIVDLVGRRAATRELAFDHNHGGNAARSSDAMDLSATALCSQVFGVSQMEAQQYLSPAEGWAPFDTNGSASGASSSTSSNGYGSPTPAGGAATGSNDLLQQLVAMQKQLNAVMSRTTISPPVKREISDALAKERREGGLCIKCGVTKYEPGGKGHNSRTCKLPVDKTTSVAEGMRKAGLSSKSPLF